ncbi:MAG TPA: NUDIX hydrolase [Planctomycetota bacterium]|jgi:8-oxo-dGTP pyrophosphatase MutT (NUDIX family)|nr:NUDIX hydrolase [Planctomycetota bacterium]
MPRPWRIVASEPLASVRVFRIRGDWAVSPRTGEVSRFTILEGREWVNVVALTDVGEIVMVRQYRHGAREVTLEIPGGIIDEGERPAQTAARELREETGYRARSIESLGWCWPNPATQTNRLHAFLALGCRRVGRVQPDPREDLEPVVVPFDRIPSLVAKGAIRHALVLAALSMLDSRESATPRPRRRRGR